MLFQCDKETGEMIKVWTYTLITRKANSVMRGIHNDGANKGRMPLLLPFELSKKLIKGDLSLDDYKSILNFEMPSEELNYIPVYSIRTNEIRPDNKRKNEYYEWENLPELVLEEIL